MRRETPRLLILIGAPGSGKSSFSENFLQTEANWIRVCRDDFRAMQFEGTKASDRTEHLITYAIEACIERLLIKKSNVLIDATHSKKEYLQQYINRFGHMADIEFKIFDVPLNVLEERVAIREQATGKHIPKDVLIKYVNELENLKKIFNFEPRLKVTKVFKPYLHDEQKPTCFLFDLDGTLADANGRNMFNPTSEDVMNDIPIIPVIRVLQAIEKHHQVIFISGREATNYQATRNWLIQHIYQGEEKDIELMMRAEGDYRRDSIIKKEILHEHILPNYNVVAAFDDRLQVVRECWNAENIFCFNVNQFLEEF